MNSAKLISIEGPIGVGKTSLAQKLSDKLNAELILEQPDSNPFLKSFYSERKNSALPTQLFFLFQRAQQLESLNNFDMFSSLRISDFMVQKDKIFAELTLTDDEIGLYNKIHDSLQIKPPKPDLVIYLQAPPNVLLTRIANRGVEYEKNISLDYLDKLCKLYAEFFYHYDESPMLIVNASAIDPISREHHFDALLHEIEKIEYGRHFFNPSVESIA
jgi:deoxyadenosine/deoxycytidine kinase